MDVNQGLALALDPTLIFKAQGRDCDPWQRDLLFSSDRQILLNCCRQSGKSTTVAALALHTALFQPGSLTLLLSRAQRQAYELFRKTLDAYNALKRPVPAVKENQSELELANKSRIVALPGREENIRSFSGVSLLLIDEAAKVPDDLYYSVRPMLAVSRGRIILLSTPFGQRGFFFYEWNKPADWKRVQVTWRQCPRISADFVEGERRSMGDSWVGQEYECLFSAMEGLVYPEFSKCEWTGGEAPAGKPVGGIDFGWRNPFAAIWGVLDRDDVLWLYGERYLRETPLHEHTKALRAIGSCMWYADPAGRTETEEMRAAGLTVRKGDNDIKTGIAAVTARLQTGRLKVYVPHCRMLLEEAKLYRYPREDERGKVGENPIDDHNHALGALRYLISRIDARYMAKLRKTRKIDGPEEVPTLDPLETAGALYGARPWLRLDNEELWTPLN